MMNKRLQESYISVYSDMLSESVVSYPVPTEGLGKFISKGLLDTQANQDHPALWSNFKDLYGPAVLVPEERPATLEGRFDRRDLLGVIYYYNETFAPVYDFKKGREVKVDQWYLKSDLVDTLKVTEAFNVPLFVTAHRSDLIGELRSIPEFRNKIIQPFPTFQPNAYVVGVF